MIGGTFSAPFRLGGETLEPDGWDRTYLPDRTDFYLSAFDSAGNHAWSRRYGGNVTDSLDDLAVMPNGELIAVGSFAGHVPLGDLESLGDTVPNVDVEPLQPGPRKRGYVAQFDAEGASIAAATIAVSDTNVWGWRVASTIDGSLVVGGRFFYSVTVEGIGRLLTPQWGDAFIATVEAP